MRPIMLSDAIAAEGTSTHVDDFIDDYTKDAYARWMFMHFRLPAFQKAAFAPFIKDHKLFCTYKGNRYRVTGASRLGDVWLIKDFKADHSYDHRVAIDDCSDWSKYP